MGGVIFRCLFAPKRGHFCMLINKITLVGFGTFETKRRNARDGRNPKTGETIYIPSTKVVNFKEGKKLKQTVNRI